MRHVTRFCCVLVLLVLSSRIAGQAPLLPDVGEPLLRLEAGGPTSDVTALALAPDGQTLYAAGWDKVVRVWKRDARTGAFVAQRVSFRVPIGPGLHGAINSLALSADGNWLAVGGLGVFRGQAGYRLPGLVVPSLALTPSMREDEGTIFVFANPRPGTAHELRGHHGPVLGLAFVHQEGNQTPLLVSAARDWSEEKQQSVGAVRVWDLKTDKSVAELTGLPDPVGRLPGIAAWRAGPQPKDIRVAFAWDDGDFNRPGQLRLWQVAREPAAASVSEDGRFNNTVAYLPSSGQLLTGSWRRTDFHGQVRRWSVANAEAPQAGKSEAAFLRLDQTVFFPRSLALVSSHTDGKLDHAAVVVRVMPSDEYRLLLLPLGTPKAYRAEDGVPLWTGGRVPVLAAAPRGAHIAVAGSRDDAIRVYEIADLLKGKAEPQVLRSIGEQVNYAAFVRKGEGKAAQRGFVLNAGTAPGRGAEPREVRQGDMILDVTGRRLLSGLGGWSVDRPASRGWTHTLVPADPKNPGPARIEVSSPAGNKRSIALPEGRVVTQHALLPPLPPLNRPVLAAASTKGNEPVLSLYDGSSGDLICQFNGHLGPIVSLAFSGDGRMLLSAARDQTVCLWSLAGLETFVGKRGQLSGVVVQQIKGGLEITEITPDGAAGRLLKKGDVLEGLVSGAQLQPLASPPEFYNALLAYAPGAEATLRLRGGRDIKVPVRQAAQERTPLMELFVTRGGRVEDREWLAWSPLGPYDSSTPRMARAFGWHFNTGKAAEPVAFTPADEARAGERRDGLLKHVLARGSLASALEDYEREKKRKPLPPPEMTLGIDDMERQVVRQPRDTLRFHVEGAAAERVGSLQWRLDDGPFAKFAEAVTEEQVLDCAQPLEWKRGLHRIQVRLRTNEEVPQEFFRHLTVRYVPPPPQVEPRGVAAKARPGQALTVTQEEFALEAIVRPAQPGERAKVQLYHQRTLLDTPAAQKEAISRKIKLQPGSNRIEVVAVNAGAEAGAADLETTQMILNITYTPPRPPEVVPAPLIALEALVPLLGGKDPGPPLVFQPGKVAVVSVPHIRLLGTIRAVKELVRAQRLDKEGNFTTLARFVEGTRKDLNIDEPLTLQPGSQKIRLRARTATSPEAEQFFEVEYRPALPTPGLTAVPTGPTFYDEGQGAPEIQLGGVLKPPRDPAPAGVKLKATILLNDKEMPATVAPDGKSWSAKVRLEPRQNRIRLKLANEWQESIFGNVEMDYLRPPHNLRASVPDSSDRPSLDLSARVDSVLPLTPKSVRATGNGRQATDVQVTAIPGSKAAWELRLKLPLDPGRNHLELDVSNAEGSLREPVSWEVIHVPPQPLPAPPSVVVLQPESTAETNEYGLKVSRPDLPVRFQVRSSAPLERVTLAIRRAQQPVKYNVFDAAAAKKSATGFELTAAADLNLPPGVTTLVLEARNKGGVGSSPALLVNYVPPPVRVVLESFEAAEGDESRQAIKEKDDGKWANMATGSARLWLRGKVIWGQADARLARREPLRVYVNGAQQWRGELAPAAEGSLVRNFKAGIVLNRASNKVEVDLPELRLEENAVRGLRIDCRNPLTEQWLHVQVISPDDEDQRQLIDQVLKTLQAANYSAARGEFSRPGFSRARLYPPMAEDVDRDKVVYRLLSIKRQIAQRGREGWPNDVVLVYYLGGEMVDTDGQLVSLTQGKPPQPLITRGQLEREFADMLGVKVLLLDVTRFRSGNSIEVEQVRREVARWLDAPTHFAWMRAAWLGGDPVPPEARLLTALQDALREAPRLGDVTQRLDRRFRVLTERFGSLRGDWYLPAPLGELALGAMSSAK